MNSKSFLKHQWPGICWAFFILIISGIPGNKIPEVNVVSADKIVHFGVYGLLSFLLLFGFYRASEIELTIKLKRLVIASSIFYGVLIEILQGTVFVGRSMDVYDMVANSIGAFVGLAGFSIYKKFLA